MGNELLSSLTQIILGIVGALSVSAIGLSTFFFNRMKNEIKRKALVNAVNRYIDYIENVKSFQLMSAEAKKMTVAEKAQQFAVENDITISESELSLIIEKSIQSLRSLENVGLRMMKKISLEDGGNNERNSEK